MMNDSEIKRYIREEIRRYADVILSGAAGQNTVDSETIESLYPGSPSIPARPVMHPFGFASRAPVGTIQVTARTGDHPGNRMVLGHRDKNRPTDLEEGTAKIYSLAGFQVYCGSDGVYVGKDGATEPLVLGQVANEFFTTLLQLLVAHVHPSPGAPSDKSADFQQLQTDYIDNNALFSTGDGGLS